MAKMPKKPPAAKKPKVVKKSPVAGKSQVPGKVRRQTSPAEDLRAAIRRLMPSAFDGDKLNTAKLAALAGGKEADGGSGRYLFDWAGRKDAVAALHDMPPLTLAPDVRGSVGFDGARNLFLEGDNLEVMKLLRRAYAGKVKMVYIDPPYNTGNDFVYKDNYRDPYRAYLKQSGITDGGGAKTSAAKEEKGLNGNRHSRWLTMMYPRLCVARDLMRDDGVMFVSIDDNEFHHLRLLMNRVFGEENFMANIVWHSTKSVTSTALIASAHTYNLVYAKNMDYYKTNRHLFRLPEPGTGFSNPDNDPRGAWKADPFQVGGIRPDQQYEIKNPKTGKIYKPNPGNSWKNHYQKFLSLLADNRIVFGVSGEAGPQRKRFLHEAKERGRVITDLWSNIATNTNATSAMQKLMGGNYFDSPKPAELVMRFANLCTKDDDIVLDFFAGSGTTGHAVMQLNAEDGGKRRFILVQMSEQTPEKSDARTAGYNTIADIAKERLRRAGKQITKSAGLYAKETDVKFKVFRMEKTALPLYTPPQEPTMDAWVAAMKKTEQMKITADDDAVIAEILLAEGYPLEVAMQKIPVKNPETGKQLSVYKITAEIGGAPQNLYVCLDKQLYGDITWDLGMRDRKELFVCPDTSIPDASTGNNMLAHAMVKTI